MSTKDQTHASTLTREALLAAQEDDILQPLLDRLAKVAEGRDDLRAEVAGTWPVSGSHDRSGTRATN